MSGRMRKIQIVVGTVAMVFAFFFGAGGHIGMQSASAEPITVPSDGWTPGNFASSCRAAGGRVIEIDSPGIKYSKCVFPDGGVNKCDWIKKTCTFGFVVQTGGRFDVSATNAGVLDAGTVDTGAGPKTNVSSSRVAKGAIVDRKGD